MPAQSPDEIFDLVDEHDTVIGQATRAQVHAQKLLHRATHVFVFNSRGELLLQKRSAEKDEFPLCWTSSASGHLDAGENYEQAARRELHEELGLTAELEFLFKLPASPETAYEHTALLRAVSDEGPRFPSEEVESVEFYSLEQITEMVEDSPESFSPPLRQLLLRYPG